MFKVYKKYFGNATGKNMSIEDKFSPDKKSLTEVFKSSGGNIFSRTLGRLFGAGLPPGGEGPMSSNTTAKWSRRTKQTDPSSAIPPPASSHSHLNFKFHFSLNFNSNFVLTLTLTSTSTLIYLISTLNFA